MGLQSGTIEVCLPYSLEIILMNLDDAIAICGLGVQESKIAHALWV